MARARSEISKQKRRSPPRAARAADPATGSSRAAPIEAELEAWRARAIPDASAPLDADDVARLVRGCFDAMGVAGAGASFSVHTVHYYRRKDILDEPEGRTAAARYGLHHVWQAVGARLAGYLGLVTLAEARDVIRGASDATLRRFAAERVADARAREAARQHDGSPAPARPLSAPAVSPPAKPAAATASVLSLGGDALCLIPTEHAALRSSTAARRLVGELARQLGLDS